MNNLPPIPVLSRSGHDYFNPGRVQIDYGQALTNPAYQTRIRNELTGFGTELDGLSERISGSITDDERASAITRVNQIIHESQFLSTYHASDEANKELARNIIERRANILGDVPRSLGGKRTRRRGKSRKQRKSRKQKNLGSRENLGGGNINKIEQYILLNLLHKHNLQYKPIQYANNRIR